MTVTPKILLDDYNYWNQHTQNWQRRKKTIPFLKALAPKPDRLRLFEELLVWCASKNVPPRQWLYGLFANRRWLFAPQLELGHLCSVKQIPKFGDLDDWGLFRSYIAKFEKLGDVYDPNVHITPSVESAKREYLGNGGPQLCVVHMVNETFGFHPKSGICGACPGKQWCLTQLQALCNFDVVALRTGAIDSEQAREQAVSQSQGYSFE